MIKANEARVITNNILETAENEKMSKHISFCETDCAEAISRQSSLGDDSVNVVVNEGYNLNLIKEYLEKNGYKVDIFYGYKMSVIKIEW